MLLGVKKTRDHLARKFRRPEAVLRLSRLDGNSSGELFEHPVHIQALDEIEGSALAESFRISLR